MRPSMYGIYREEGPAARRRASQFASSSPRRMAVIEAPNQREALTGFAKAEKLRSRQVDSWRFEWRGSRSMARRWKPDDGRVDSHGRDWRLIVTIRNGQNIHEARYLAWKQA